MNQEISSPHQADQADPHNHKHTPPNPETLKLSDQFFEPVDRQIVQWLKLAPDSYLLDAGCGAGGLTQLLAEVAGPGGRMVGLDANPILLEFDRAEVSGTNLAQRINFQEGDVRHLPFEDGLFDLAWCSRVIHGLTDQLADVRELGRVVRPGGRVVLRERGLPVQFLPFDLGIGEPGLEGRIQVVRAKWFANWRASLPNAVTYPFGWSYMLTEAGLSQVIARSFLYEFSSPLKVHQQIYLDLCWLHCLS